MILALMSQPNHYFVSVRSLGGIFFVLVGSLLGGAELAATDSFEPAGSGGIVALDQALHRIQTNRRVLVIGAHPDDEDTSLLTLVSRGMGGEAAYLSLTRGDGGQNLIGEELGEGLGVLRTEELLAARRIDGARQFFSRAYDYGYSKTLEEALTQWPEETLLEDVVRVVRRFRPQVIVAIFPPDARAGHGQHQASGYLAERAFQMAGGASAFPSLTSEGLLPWTPQRFFRDSWFDPENAGVTLPMGDVDPLTGRTYYQLAMESRSQHRCQSFGSLQPLKSRDVVLQRQLLDQGVADDGQLFGEIDTRLRGLAESLPEARRSVLEGKLITVEQLAVEARGALNASNLAATVPGLREIVLGLRDARQLADSWHASHVSAVLSEKEALAQEALATALGWIFDATTNQAEVVPGDSLEITARFLNGSRIAVALPGGRLRFVGDSVGSEGVTGSLGVLGSESELVLEPGELWEESLSIPIADSARSSVPYQLRNPRLGSMYDYSGVPVGTQGEALSAPPLTADFSIELPGPSPIQLTLSREVVFRRRDLAEGEQRLPIRVVPRLEVEVTPRQILRTQQSDESSSVDVTLSRRGDQPVRGELRFRGPSDWPDLPVFPFDLKEHSEVTLSIDLDLPPLGVGRRVLEVEAVLFPISDGKKDSGTGPLGGPFDLSLPTIDYAHVRPRVVPVRSRIDVIDFDLKLPTVKRVGYLPGADPRVGLALASVGVPVEILSAATAKAELEHDLKAFEVIVVGSRAYESSPELVAINELLLDFARRGGLLVVEFQRWNYFEQGLAPYPMELTRRNRHRTTDEEAPVRVLEAGQRAMKSLNALGPSDWEGWIQERGTYYPVSWDPHYSPWLSMADPGEEEVQGALLEANVGEGVYIYTGVAFFRQLPAGISGAFRLFANLLGRAPRAVEVGR